MTDISITPGLLEACWRCFVLGVIQGLTEFLPISSTAHLKALPMLLGWGDPGVSVTAVLQLGSIVAVIGYFKNELNDILKGIALAFRFGRWGDPNARLGIAICSGTVPILFAGMATKIFWTDFEQSPARSIPAIAIISILMAILLAIAEEIGSRTKTLSKVSGKDGFVIGFGQMLALIPGVSRSGITLTSSLLNGWKRQDAAKFSFLLGIPAICFAGLVELKDAFHGPITSEGLPLLVGISAAAAVSWISIDWLLKYLQSHSTSIFVIYRVVFGFVLLIWWWGIA